MKKIRTRFRLLLLPSAILLLAGCALNISGTSALPENIPQESRLLTMRAPEMFCIGCTSSIEAAIGAVPGVHYVSADAETKEVNVIYDPDQITSDEIFSQSVFDVYGREFISDNSYFSSP